MTVQELIQTLNQFPKDMLVLTDGYESGYEEVLSPAMIEVKHEPENNYYDGEYQPAEDSEPHPIKAVAILRNRRDD